MRAIVAKMAHDGSYRKVGMIDRFITGDYLTLEGLLRYGIPADWKAYNLRIDIYSMINHVTPDASYHWLASTGQAHKLTNP